MTLFKIISRIWLDYNGSRLCKTPVMAAVVAGGIAIVRTSAALGRLLGLPYRTH